MEDAQNINICISGWPGSGSTTLALIMSHLLKRQFIHIGQVYRQLGNMLGFSSEGSARPEFDDYIENIIGKTIDAYTDYKLLNSQNLLLESDLAAFRIGKHPKVYSIFLRTEQSERIKRVVEEGRQDAELILEKRDKLLKSKYQELWQIDYFDEELISKKYTLKFDNSNLSLETELKLILEQLRSYSYFSYLENDYWLKLNSRIQTEVDHFWKDGKQSMIEDLIKAGLYMEPLMVMQDIAKTFPEDVIHYPENIRNIFLGISK